MKEHEKGKMFNVAHVTNFHKSFLVLMEALALLQVLADFPNTTAELRVDYLLDLFPEIQPRSFSIASSLQVTRSFMPTIHTV